jgi:hypothetical protein
MPEDFDTTITVEQGDESKIESWRGDLKRLVRRAAIRQAGGSRESVMEVIDTVKVYEERVGVGAVD